MPLQLTESPSFRQLGISLIGTRLAYSNSTEAKEGVGKNFKDEEF